MSAAQDTVEPPGTAQLPWLADTPGPSGPPDSNSGVIPTQLVSGPPDSNSGVIPTQLVSGPPGPQQGDHSLVSPPPPGTGRQSGVGGNKAMTQVDLVGLQKAINVFSQGVQNFDTQYKAMSTTATTIASNWTGAASTSFEQAMNNWLNDFYKVVNVLNGMENALTQNTSVLSQTNDTTIAAAQRAAAGITAPQLPGF